MMDLKKIEDGLKFLDSSLAATRRFHGIESEQQTAPEQPKRWWQRRRPDPPPPTLVGLYDQLYRRFETHLTGLCAEILPVFKIFVYDDGICINGKSGDVGWLKITHSRHNHLLSASEMAKARVRHGWHSNETETGTCHCLSGSPPHALTIHFAAHKVYTYEEHPLFDGRSCVKDKMEPHNNPDVLLKFVALWPEFQSGLHGWLDNLRETNCRKIDEANKALASLGT